MSEIEKHIPLHTEEAGIKEESPINHESSESLPINVIDNRPSEYRTYDVNELIKLIGRVRKEDFYTLSRNFPFEILGKYMGTFASSESNHWVEAIKRAQAIQITLDTMTRFGIEPFTIVTIKVLMDKNEGRSFRFTFTLKGEKANNYRNGSFNDVHLIKRMTGDEPEAFVLEEQIPPRQLKETN
jgi:hypothetical protein